VDLAGKALEIIGLLLKINGRSGVEVRGLEALLQVLRYLNQLRQFPA
jgi:hypothetical protein